MNGAGYVLARGVPLTQDGPLIVDLPTATLELRATLDGAAPTAADTSWGDQGRLTLEPASPQRGAVPLPPVVRAEGGAPQPSWPLRLLPGSYRVYYRADDPRDVPAPRWPGNGHAPLACFVVPPPVAR